MAWTVLRNKIECLFVLLWLFRIASLVSLCVCGQHGSHWPGSRHQHCIHCPKLGARPTSAIYLMWAMSSSRQGVSPGRHVSLTLAICLLSSTCFILAMSNMRKLSDVINMSIHCHQFLPGQLGNLYEKNVSSQNPYIYKRTAPYVRGSVCLCGWVCPRLDLRAVYFCHPWVEQQHFGAKNHGW